VDSAGVDSAAASAGEAAGSAVVVAAASREVARVAVGSRRRVQAAVADAEDHTGLEITVYLGDAGDDARARAEQMFVASGSHARPAVLVLVAPAARRVEIVTAPAVRSRVTDEACAHAVDRMVECFRDGRIDEGIVVGLEELKRAAGPGVAPPDAEELPDVLGSDDDAIS
jgi:uncharacterized membrane protein